MTFAYSTAYSAISEWRVLDLQGCRPGLQSDPCHWVKDKFFVVDSGLCEYKLPSISSVINIVSVCSTELFTGKEMMDEIKPFIPSC